MEKVLFSWIGNSDGKACRAEEDRKGDGPIADAMAGRTFERVVLLDDNQKGNAGYGDWLFEKTGVRPEILPISLSGPTNYAEIYCAVRKVLAKQETTSGKFGEGWSVLISAGTSAMASVWLILAGTLYPKVKLLETSKEKGLLDVAFPFDLWAEFEPDLLRRQADNRRRLGDYSDSLISAFNTIIHTDSGMHKQLLLAQHYARFGLSILILGESGTGKEGVASAVHKASGRDGNFVAVNCGAIPESLIDSELFGYEKGAFTGAVSHRIGKIEESAGGTLFLDEVGELPPHAQVRLLRVLQEKRVMRVGAVKESEELNLMVVAATHRPLAAEVVAGRFREDLYYRLAVGIIELPPLRNRSSDIPDIAKKILNDMSDALHKAGLCSKSLSAGAMHALKEHTWPGNVRELQNALWRAALRSNDEKISKEDILASILRMPKHNGDTADYPLEKDFSIEIQLKEIEATYYRRALKQANNNKSRAASLLGITRQAFGKALTRLSIPVDN